MKPLLSIVMPARNEEDILGDTLEIVEKTLSIPHETIVVDDYSTDRTAAVVLSCRNKYPAVRLLPNMYPAGFPSALKAGWENAAAPVVVIMMADLCDEVEAIPRMYEKIREGYDVVCGSRYMRGGGKRGGRPLQNLFSRFVGLTMYHLAGVPTHDVSNAFKMYRKEALPHLDLRSRAFDASMEMTLHTFYRGLRITEIPTVWRGRTKGISKFRMLTIAPGYVRLYVRALAKNIFQ